MNRKNNASLFRAIILIIIAFLLVVAVFLFSKRNQTSSITLPDASPEQSVPADSDGSQKPGFVQVTTDNVLAVVETLHRPSAYRQTYTVTYTEDAGHTTQKISVLINGKFLRVDTVINGGTNTVLSDGTDVWQWHTEDMRPVKIPLSAQITPDDLIGIPTYESLLSLSNSDLSRAEYVTLQQNIDCIYVASQKDNTEIEYWIDISSGLLYLAQMTVGEQIVYTVCQGSLEILTPEDETFHQNYVLPNGSIPFSAE